MEIISSHSGTPRTMHQNYLDAITVVEVHEKPNFFITIACNPNWIDITDVLWCTATAGDRPDLGARVLKIKLLDYIFI